MNYKQDMEKLLAEIPPVDEVLGLFSKNIEGLQEFLIYRPLMFKDYVATKGEFTEQQIKQIIVLFLNLFNRESFWDIPAAPYLCRFYRPMLEGFMTIMDVKANLKPLENEDRDRLRSLFFNDVFSEDITPPQLMLWAVCTLNDRRNYSADVLRLKYKALALVQEHGLGEIKKIVVNKRLVSNMLIDLFISVTHIEGERAGMAAFEPLVKNMRAEMDKLFIELMDTLVPVETEYNEAEADPNSVVIYLEKASYNDSGLASCFFPLLRGLAKSFKVQVLSHQEVVGLDELPIVRLPDNQPTTLLAEIAKIKPGVVISYSAFMTYRTATLASFRVAPVQLVLPGYPVLSDTPRIDGTVYTRAEIEEGQHVPGPFRPEPMRYQTLRDADVTLYSQWAPRDNSAHIGLAANSYKLTSPYMAALKEKQAHNRQTAPMVFHLFGKAAWYEEEVLKKGFKNMLVYQPEGLPIHLERVAKTHFLAAAYPFGNLVGIVHALQIGVPTLVLKGSHPNSRAGAAVLESIGLHDFVAHDPDDYWAKMVEHAKNRAAIVDRRPAIMEAVQAILAEEDDGLVKVIEQLRAG